MFTPERRNHVRDHILELARNDPRVTAGALTGSMSLGAEDGRSDIDLAFGIADGIALATVLQDWTQVFDQEFGVLGYFDLPSGPAMYRAFLLADGLEVDVGVTPASAFGALGPSFRLLFGAAQPPKSPPPPDAHHLIGLAWHHVLHARSAIERGKPWQAEFWISGIRDHTLALACIRLGESAHHGRGLDRLPAALTTPLADTLVRSLDAPELRRALAVATACLIGELAAWDPALGTRFTPVLQEFGTSQTIAASQSSPAEQ